MTNAKLDNHFDEPMGILDMAIIRLKGTVSKPANIAWSLGILGTVGYVFANALFLQDTAHPSAFFDTRSEVVSTSLQPDELRLPVAQNDVAEKQVTRIVLDSQSATAPQPLPVQRPATIQQVATNDVPSPQALPTVKRQNVGLLELQGLLSELGFYTGEVDGLDGPKTRAAIEAYKSNVGLKGIELTSAELITSAKNNLIVTAAVPKNRPAVAPSVQIQSSIKAAPRPVETVSYKPPSVAQSPKVDETVRKVQAGLRAFGDSSISVDGVSGAQTVAAIRDFQGLFELPVNGKIDDQLISKMRSVGLID